MIESVRTLPGDSGLSERHQELSIRTELEDLVPLSVSSLGVGRPDVALLVHVEAEFDGGMQLQKTGPAANCTCPAGPALKMQPKFGVNAMQYALALSCSTGE